MHEDQFSEHSFSFRSRWSELANPKPRLFESSFPIYGTVFRSTVTAGLQSFGQHLWSYPNKSAKFRLERDIFSPFLSVDFSLASWLELLRSKEISRSHSLWPDSVKYLRNFQRFNKGSFPALDLAGISWPEQGESD